MPSLQDLPINILNPPELERNAQRPCVSHDKFHKKSHKLSPDDLTAGFGLHTVSSLELAIRKARKPRHICICEPCPDVPEEAYDEEIIGPRPSLLSIMAEEQLRYLMGLPSEAEEHSTTKTATSIKEVCEDENLINGSSEAMRKAQRYLREHKIFEYFQFLIAHMLAEIPYDPITFLINLLDKCLTYRSGVCDPPLLYNKKHIDCLFNLMDRMRTGFIDFDQYRTGMYTLGIQSYNPTPPMTLDHQVTKVFFIEECYECLKDLLNDMIRKRTPEVKKVLKVLKAPPPSTIKSLCPSMADVDLFV